MAKPTEKKYYQLVKNLHAYQHAKHQLHNSIRSCDIAKTLHTCYFEYFLHALPHL